MDEAARKAKAVGQAHTAREYRIHDKLVAKGFPNEDAWRITMSQAPRSRGRRPSR